MTRWAVVGAGSAGCVVSRRLADAGHHVTLVEAGPPLRPGEVPGTISGDDCFAALTDDRIHPDLVATRVGGQEPSRYVRGRGIGGSSAVNAMVALHGDDSLYRSWGWDDVAEARAQIRIPVTVPADDELGDVDRAVLASAPDAVVVPLTREHGRRVTAAEAYLWDLEGSDRLDVVTDSVVDRVVLDDGGRAAGVRLADGAVVGAENVVVSAGAIHTPAILLRSEFGGSLDGVGQGLQDHAAAAIALELARPAPVDASTGRLGLAACTIVDRDPIQILGMNHLGADESGAAGPLGLLMVSLMRPVSASGSVTLRSDDPCDDPVVRFDLLSDRRDVEVLRGGVRDALELLDAEPFAELVRAAYIDDAGTTVDELAHDGAIDEWLLTRSADYVHASSSCAMGRVVDADGAVPSVPGLYVCDASVFPSIPNVNTHLPTTMLAERLSSRWLARPPARMT